MPAGRKSIKRKEGEALPLPVCINVQMSNFPGYTQRVNAHDIWSIHIQFHWAGCAILKISPFTGQRKDIKWQAHFFKIPSSTNCSDTKGKILWRFFGTFSIHEYWHICHPGYLAHFASNPWIFGAFGIHGLLVHIHGQTAACLPQFTQHAEERLLSKDTTW